jgi:hypothetical protein
MTLPSQLPSGTGTYPVQTPTSFTIRDLNADGKLDLAVGGYDEVALAGYYEFRHDGYQNVLLGNGDGTFSSNAAKFVANTLDIQVIRISDFDGDNKSDVLVGVNSNVGGNSGYLNVYVGNGDGTIQSVPFTTNLGFRTISRKPPVADFDQDGTLDVLSINLSNAVVVMIGNGDGTFRSSDTVSFGGDVQSTSIGDVNANGHFDIVGLSSVNIPIDDGDYQSTRFVRVLLGNGNGDVCDASYFVVGKSSGL